MAKNLIKDTISNIGSTISGGIEGGKALVGAAVSQYKAGAMERKHVQSMIGPESVFGMRNMEKQKKELQRLQKANDYKGMRAYMADQYTKAGLKKVGNNYIKIK